MLPRRFSGGGGYSEIKKLSGQAKLYVQAICCALILDDDSDSDLEKENEPYTNPSDFELFTDEPCNIIKRKSSENNANLVSKIN